MNDLETVYAIQDFKAENLDELTFHTGETITVIQKDDGFNDGWWKGRNTRGEIGIFPMNYITSDTYSCQSISSTITKKPIQINTTMDDSYFPSEQSSFSFQEPISASTSEPTSMISNNSPSASNDIRKAVVNTLLLPHLRSTLPKNWDMYQVETWLHALQFESIVENFKAHEITGDILMELDMESLKELDIVSFGKRFKLYNAIIALREECGFQPPNIQRLSTYSDDPQSPTTPSSSTQYSIPTSKNTPSYHSKSQRTKNFHGEHFNDDHIVLPTYDVSPIIPSSNYDIMEMNKHNYVNRQFDSKLVHSVDKRDVNFLHQAQKHQHVLSIAQQPVTENNHGVPDMEGWLYKQASKYKKWNKRWFVLKGSNLFYFKSPTDIRMKGIIHLRGYRIVVDETIQAGKYSFKAQHEQERTFFFYTQLELHMRTWISCLMKATISRDFVSPVLSSSVIPTVSLDVAQRMRPRPPSALLYKKDAHDSKNEEHEGDSKSLACESRWSINDYIEWVNLTISNSDKINCLQDLRHGDILVEILEKLSGKSVTSMASKNSVSDNISVAFRFMEKEGIDMTNQVTVQDIYEGKKEKIKTLLGLISEWSARVSSLTHS